MQECPPGVLADSDPDFLGILEQRIADFESGKHPGIPWEEFRVHMEKKLNAGQTPRRSRA